MGGYVGARRFVVVYNNSRIVYSEVGSGDYDFVGIGCEKAIAQGLLPPMSAQQAAAVPIDPSKPRLGIAFKAVPDGAYIGAVEPGSAASSAGIVSGMVISHINAIPIKGFDDATVGKLLQAGEGVTLTIIGKGDVHLKKAPILPAETF
ncbi:hypothetical protein [Sphingomonas antarctica]|uniref:hypothetical protein n=1 Tax=Sphingomonas antarctica TaxID=2040274 RepID=UPI0039E7DD2F